MEAPRLQNSRHINVVNLSALSTGLLYPQEIFPVFISVRGSVDPRAIVRPEGLCQLIMLMILSGIEPATLWLVAQFYRNVLLVNNDLVGNSTPPPALRLTFTEERPSVESLTNYVAVLRCAVGQRRYEVWRRRPTVTYRNRAQLTDSRSDLG